MKDTWYSDHRDLVKWGTLVHLARSEEIKTVIQVAFHRRGERPPLQTDQGKEDIAQEVWQYLRDINLICGLGEKTGLDIVVLDQEFDLKRRREYIWEVADCLKSRPENKVVLLDPDTGIEPKKRAGPTHVKVIEIQELWEVLLQDDWLVLYQHASRKANWCECMREVRESLWCERRRGQDLQGEKDCQGCGVLRSEKTVRTGLYSFLHGKW